MSDENWNGDRPPRGNGGNFASFMEGKGEALQDMVKNSDRFGYDKNFNYEGQRTIKTLPGGCLSIFMVVCFLAYLVGGHSEISQYKKWWLTQQTVMSTPQELMTALPFKNYTNVSIALEFAQKPTVLK